MKVFNCFQPRRFFVACAGCGEIDEEGSLEFIDGFAGVLTNKIGASSLVRFGEAATGYMMLCYFMGFSRLQSMRPSSMRVSK